MSRFTKGILVLLAGAALAVLLMSPRERSLPEIPEFSEMTEADEPVRSRSSLPSPSLENLPVHFPDDRIAVEPVAVEVLPVKIQPEGPQYTAELKYVSSVVKEGRKSWFFKSSGTNRIYELAPGKEASPWSWVSEEADYFLLKKNDILFKVRK